MSNFFKDLKLVGKASETIEALNQEINRLKIEINEASNSIEAFKAEISRSNAAKAQTQKTLDETSKALNDAKTQSQKEVTDLKSKLGEIESQQKDTTEENELLLLQLHQVQEELEHYFLKYQDIKQQAETTQQRLERVLADHPNYFSYDQVQCEPVSGHADHLRWTISGLFGVGRYWDRCQFETIIEKGIAGFVFKKRADGSSPLAFWPNSHTSQTEVTCIPTGTSENAKQRAELLKTLSTSDWQLLKLLPEILISALNKEPSLAPTNQKQLLDALHKTHDLLLKHLPTVLRFDKVELTKALVHPGYEHLAFRVHNLKFGKKIHPTFDFRLGCANVTEHRFGSDPKLEFPLIHGKPPLESWYAESEDEFGPKLEIRFALPDAMDLEVWEKIKHAEKCFIANIIEILPAVLEKESTKLLGIDRPQEDWINASVNIRAIFNNHISNNKDLI